MAAKEVLQPELEPGHEAGGLAAGVGRMAAGHGARGGLRRWRRDGRGRVVQHALDDGLLAVGRLLAAAGDDGGVFKRFGQFVAGGQGVKARVVVLEALELVVGRFQRFVGHEDDGHALAQLDLGDFGALFVEQEAGHFHRHLHVHGGGVVLHGLFLDDAQDLQRARFGVAHVAGAAAARAGNGCAFGEGGLEALAAHFQQAEFADGAKLHAGAVLAQGFAQAVFHFAAVFAFLHVDEVDDDEAAQIAQAHLAGHFVGGFEVGAGGGFFDVAALDGAGGVHVHRHKGFGVVDDDGAARGQLHGAAVGAFHLVLDLEARKQRRGVAVALDAAGVLGHHVAHELLGLLEHVVGVDQDFANVAAEVVAHGADDQAAFGVDQHGALAAFGRVVNGAPELEQVVQVPLQVGRAAAYAGGAGDDGHALGVFELVHRLFQLGALVTLDAARNAAAARVVGHEHHVAPGQADEGGERRALVAALFFFHLHQQFLAFLDDVVDARLRNGHAFSEVLARDFLERQKAVAFFAVVHKARLQRWLYARDHGFVNVALALLAPLHFDFVVKQFLSIDDRQAALFGLRGIDQHPFHDALSFVSCKSKQARQGAAPHAAAGARSETKERETGARQSAVHPRRGMAGRIRRHGGACGQAQNRPWASPLPAGAAAAGAAGAAEGGKRPPNAGAAA